MKNISLNLSNKQLYNYYDVFIRTIEIRVNNYEKDNSPRKSGNNNKRKIFDWAFYFVTAIISMSTCY